MATEQKRRGVLVAIEGIDGAGKTLQVEMLSKRLKAAGLDVITTKEPTNGHVERMRQAVREGKRLPVEEELRIFVEDRRQHVEAVIRPALEAGKVVILDRYYFSNVAYQGSRGIDPVSIMRENEAFAPIPNLLVLLDIPVDVAIDRIRRRGIGRTLFEDPDALERCREVFLSIHREYAILVDGRRSPQEIHEAIVKRLDAGALFRSLCLKPYLQQCEPEYCSYRLDGSCEWIKFGSLREPAYADPVIDERRTTAERRLEANREDERR